MEGFIAGMFLGLCIGFQQYWSERQFRKEIEKHRDEIRKDKDFWVKMYDEK